MSIWPEHPLFSAADSEEAERRLDMLGDGHIALGADGSIVSINNDAASQLLIDHPRAVTRLSQIGIETRGWDRVIEAVSQNRRGDFPVVGTDGQRLLATLSRTDNRGEIRLITLRDIEAFQYRFDRAFGQRQRQSDRFQRLDHTRPDFATQRQLCPEINRLLNRGERAMRHGAKVLITGESGVGKTEIARFLHGTVSDSRDPFLVVNCASLSESHLESFLFGDAAGNGASGGALKSANGGTVFLDELAELPLSIQARLVGYLEDREPSGTQDGSPRSRIVSATNKDLKRLVAKGAFRADLYFRLAVINLRVPPLRDLTPLVSHLIDRFSRTINQRRHTPMIVPVRIREVLSDYSFPGNIRELHNIVQRIAVFIEDSEGLDELIAELIAPMDSALGDADTASGDAVTLDLRTEVRRFERNIIDKAIRVHGSKRKAAKALGVDIGTVVRKTATPHDQVNEPEHTTNMETRQ